MKSTFAIVPPASSESDMQICKKESAYLHKGKSQLATELFEMNAAAAHSRTVTGISTQCVEKKERNPAAEIKNGSVTVRIAGREPGPWYVCYYDGNIRKREK